MRRAVLYAVTRHEQELGLFYLVGNMLYNTREESAGVDNEVICHSEKALLPLRRRPALNILFPGIQTGPPNPFATVKNNPAYRKKARSGLLRGLQRLPSLYGRSRGLDKTREDVDVRGSF